MFIVKEVVVDAESYGTEIEIVAVKTTSPVVIIVIDPNEFIVAIVESFELYVIFPNPTPIEGEGIVACIGVVE